MKKLLQIFAFIFIPILSFSQSQIQVTSYHYRPPIGWQGTRFKSNPPGSSLHIFVHNNTECPISAQDIFLNSKKVAIREADSLVVWWRLLPETVLPNGYGELTIYLQKELKDTLSVEAEFNTGKIKVEIPPTEKPFQISQTLLADNSLYIYLSGVTNVDNVFFDGKKITKKCKFYPIHALSSSQAPLSLILSPRGRGKGEGASVTKQSRIGEFLNSQLLIIHKFEIPPIKGSHHLLSVEKGKEKVESIIRIFEFPFVIGSYGNTGSGSIKAYVEHNLNTYLSFHSMKIEELDRLKDAGLRVISSSKSKEDILSIKDCPNLLAYYLMDEPDVRDYFCQDVTWKRHIGWYAQEMVDWYNLRCRNASQIPSLLMVNATDTPANWYIYSQISDIPATDPYAKLFRWKLEEILTVGKILRNAGAPRIFLMAIQAHYVKEKKEEKVTILDYPTPVEERKMVYYAIGSGSKGLAYFIYDGGNGSACWKDNPELAEEIKKIGKTIGAIADLLTISYPVELVNQSPSSKEVRGLSNCKIQTLLCGEKAIIILVEGDEGFNGGEVEINLPKWFKVNDVFSIGYEKLEEKEVEKNKRLLKLKLTNDICQCIVVTSDSELEKMIKEKLFEK